MSKLATADRILRAAHKLMDREGPDAVTMRRVAEAVGITPMAIYRHFSNRDALLKRISDDSFASVAVAWDARSRSADVVEGLMRSLEQYLDYALDHPHMFDHAFSVRRDDARLFPEDFRQRRSPTLNVIADRLSEGMRQGRLRDIDPWDTAMTLWALAHGLISLYRAGRFSYDDEQFRTFYLHSLGIAFDGIKR